METLEKSKTEILTQAAYAKRIGVSRATVCRMVKQGKLKTLRIEGGTLILLD